jgi:hypothetical protein
LPPGKDWGITRYRENIGYFMSDPIEIADVLDSDFLIRYFE